VAKYYIRVNPADSDVWLKHISLNQSYWRQSALNIEFTMKFVKKLVILGSLPAQRSGRIRAFPQAGHL